MSWIVMDNTPIDTQKEAQRQKEWIEHCRIHQSKSLLDWKEILKPGFYKELILFIERENKRRLADDKIRYDSKYIQVKDAIYKLRRKG